MSDQKNILEEPSTPQEMMKFLYSFKPQGNVTDSTWNKLITWKNGKPHYEAISLLGDIFYWYRPSVEKDEKGNIKLSKKYKSDLLQRSYEQIEETLNMTKVEARTAMEKLEELGIAKREFRTVISNGVKNNNVMHIRFYPRRLQVLQENMLIIADTKEEDNSNIYPSSFQTNEGVISNELGSHFKRMTNTEITTKTTTEKSTTTVQEKKPDKQKGDSSRFFSKEKKDLLSELPINDTTRKNLQRFDIEILKKAIAVTKQSKYDDFGAYLYSLCKNPGDLNHVDCSTAEENRELAKRIFSKNGYAYETRNKDNVVVKIDALNTYVEISANGTFSKTFTYDDKAFKEKLNKELERIEVNIRI